jgi:chromosome partitioning protein
MECSVAIITVASAKGGVGKSTLSLVVATTLARRGASVAIVDCDPNRNLVTWRAGPSKSTVAVISDVDSSTIARVLRDTASTYQFVIADLEGTASMTVGSATLASDLVVIPARGSIMDATQARRTVAFIEDQGAAIGRAIPFRISFTCTKPGFATRDEKMIRQKLKANGLPMLQNDLAERAAYRSMFTYRLSIEELDCDRVAGLDKALANANALTDEIISTLRANREAA